MGKIFDALQKAQKADLKESSSPVEEQEKKQPVASPESKPAAEKIKIAQKLGYPVDEKLDLIDLPLNLRQKDEVGHRMLVLKAVLASAFSGENREKACKWSKQENLTEFLTTRECSFMFENKGDAEAVELQIESLWMLAWCTNLIQEMDFGDYCGDYLSDLFPSIEFMAPAIPFLRNLSLRSIEEITEALDLAYYLNRAAMEARLNNLQPPGKVREYVLEYRRKALEWLVSEEEWDTIVWS